MKIKIKIHINWNKLTSFRVTHSAQFNMDEIKAVREEVRRRGKQYEQQAKV